MDKNLYQSYSYFLSNLTQPYPIWNHYIFYNPTISILSSLALVSNGTDYEISIYPAGLVCPTSNRSRTGGLSCLVALVGVPFWVGAATKQWNIPIRAIEIVIDNLRPTSNIINIFLDYGKLATNPSNQKDILQNQIFNTRVMT